MKIILSIETSCDETSLALIITPSNPNKNGFIEFINSHKVLYQIVSSQINIHANYGGVIPEIGARHHASSIHFLFEKLLYEASKRIINSKSNYIDNESKNVENKELNKQLIVKSIQPKLNIDFEKLNEELLLQNNILIKDLVRNPNLLLLALESIMVTTNPGLTSSLRIGVEFAKSIQYFVSKKYNLSIGIEEINHLNGHVASCFFNIE